MSLRIGVALESLQYLDNHAPQRFDFCIESKPTDRNIKLSSFKSSENIQKKEGRPDRSVSDNQSSSVTLNELAMKASEDTVISSFSKEVIH